MAPQPDQHEPTVDEIDDQYAEVDPDDVAENAIDYFDGRPSTESEKQDGETG